MCNNVSVNAKMRRPGICGATETILFDEEVLNSHLPMIINSLKKLDCEVRGDEKVVSLDKSIKKATKRIGQQNISIK